MSGITPPEAGLDAIATRVYERAGTQDLVRLLIGRPEPDPLPGGDWRCRIVIEGLDKPIDRWAFGVDAIQALGLAFEIARIQLQPHPDRAPKVSWLDHADLALPRLLGSLDR